MKKIALSLSVLGALVPTQSQAEITSTLTGTELSIVSSADDSIKVSKDELGALKINGSDPSSGPIQLSALTSISIVGGPLANKITISKSIKDILISIDGGDGNDKIKGSNAPSTLSGGAGDDRIYGGKGNDIISGGDGNDFLLGGKGDDSLSGDAGDDSLNGQKGADILDGGEGADRFLGVNKKDTVISDESDPLSSGKKHSHKSNKNKKSGH